jgi:hypothetical protein
VGSKEETAFIPDSADHPPDLEDLRRELTERIEASFEVLNSSDSSACVHVLSSRVHNHTCIGSSRPFACVVTLCALLRFCCVRRTCTKSRVHQAAMNDYQLDRLLSQDLEKDLKHLDPISVEQVLRYLRARGDVVWVCSI